MGREKSKMQLIMKEKTRNITFKKRKEGLIKKLHELTILCDVSACVLIYGPEPEIWPQDPDGVQTMIEAYRSKNINDYGGRKTFGLSDFFQERERKVKDEIEKLRKKNKYPTGLDGILSNLSEEKLRNFGVGLSNKAENVRKRIELLKRNKQSGLMVVDFGQDQSFYTAPPQMFNQIQQQYAISTANFGMQCYNNNNYSAYGGLDQNPLMMLLMNGDQDDSSGPLMFNSSQACYDSNMVGPTAYNQMPSLFYEAPQPVPVPPPSMFSGGAAMEGYMDLGNQEDIINQFLMMNGL